ncbi:cysteine synthase A [bacterium 210917-DFI.7.65]|uniref:cysteine synthase A n=1 Tax=Ruthenibacterium lactatiformans TaxID=1550024 RepID=UPI002A4C6ED2|nr:cysteine synthase A [bacterium 210917-DFI.7.65]
MIFRSMTELIGATPLVELCRYREQEQLGARILAKLESFNPAGSAKDRIALRMIEDAEQTGRLQPGATIIEPTSGNTGIGLAAVAAARGYKAIFIMPETMSVERRKLLAVYGAQIVLTPGKEGMQGAVDKAAALAQEIPGALVLGQFVNPANPEAHYRTTGPEIWRDSNGTVDILVAGIGTGGTLSGAGRYLKEQNADVRVVGVEPAASPLLTEGRAGPHALQGIGANFIPDTLDRSIYDEVLPVPDEAAFSTAKALARCEGLLAGISSGAALWAAAALARRPENEGKTVVAVLTDTGERYLSTRLFEEG